MVKIRWMVSNRREQMDELEDEVEAVNAIYPGSIRRDGSLHRLSIPNTRFRVSLSLSFPSDYPAAPPSVLDAEGLSVVDARRILSHVFRGQCVIYDLLDAVRDLDTGSAAGSAEPQDVSAEDAAEHDNATLTEAVEWAVGDVIVDRKSVFQGRAARVRSARAAQQAVAALVTSEARLLRATHNVISVRGRKE